jgi:Na+/proline symporter
MNQNYDGTIKQGIVWSLRLLTIWPNYIIAPLAPVIYGLLFWKQGQGFWLGFSAGVIGDLAIALVIGLLHYFYRLPEELSKP